MPEIEHTVAPEETATPAEASTNGASLGDLDARVRLFADDGHMAVELEAYAPEGGGRHVIMEDLQAALSKHGVVYGVDEAALQSLLAPLYGQRVVVARGTPAEDGTDGTCTELFAREVTKHHKEREDGTVDYRELGLLNDVPVGTVVCKITLPTAGTDGTNTLGKRIKAHEGQKALPPIGENIKLSENGLQAVTTLPGNLIFRNGRFTVENVIRMENIDYDTGNLTFSGDVIVNGNMLDGFEIHAGGDVSLRGQVGAVVVAGRNITIDKGINGTGRAVLEAVCVIKAGFVENCTLRAGEKVIANSIINSQVECEGSVEVTGGKGIICGGSITAAGSVQAKEIGNDSNTLTNVVLGVTPKLIQERKRLADQLADVEKHLDGLSKNAAYVEGLVAEGKPVPPERIDMLKRAQIQLPLTTRKMEQLQKSLAELNAKMEDVQTAQLTARVLHPPTKVTIGTLSTTVSDTRNSCRIFKAKGEIVFGSA